MCSIHPSSIAFYTRGRDDTGNHRAEENELPAIYPRLLWMMASLMHEDVRSSPSTPLPPRLSSLRTWAKRVKSVSQQPSGVRHDQVQRQERSLDIRYWDASPTLARALTDVRKCLQREVGSQVDCIERRRELVAHHQSYQADKRGVTDGELISDAAEAVLDPAAFTKDGEGSRRGNVVWNLSNDGSALMSMVDRFEEGIQILYAPTMQQDIEPRKHNIQVQLNKGTCLPTFKRYRGK
ncbi:MAG: hypothetical protein M1826_000108 [Phylliscum demangeonii]|nr:MAG: hypothetical protein M1826_000108 [Phylliscum demangeonii]